MKAHSTSELVPRKTGRRTKAAQCVQDEPLRIGERKRRPPGASRDDPFLEFKEFSQALDVANQMSCRICIYAEMWVRSARTSLVEENSMIEFRIEKRAMRVL
jgi:hypothetical protein